MVDLDSPPPVEIPLPAPFDGVINPVTALPFERSDDLVADSLYKFNRSEMSSFNLTDNVNPDIIKNVNFSAIRNEVGQIVDHAVPPIGDRIMQLEVAGEVKILRCEDDRARLWRCDGGYSGGIEGGAGLDEPQVHCAT